MSSNLTARSTCSIADRIAGRLRLQNADSRAIASLIRQIWYNSYNAKLLSIGNRLSFSCLTAGTYSISCSAPAAPDSHLIPASSYLENLLNFSQNSTGNNVRSHSQSLILFLHENVESELRDSLAWRAWQCEVAWSRFIYLVEW